MLYCVDEICAAAQRSALILTVNQRMTRALLTEYEQWQTRYGRSVWVKPTIFTPAQWWQRCLTQNVATGTLLNHAQQESVWRRIIRTDLQRRKYALLQMDATVKQALKAYTLLCDYLIDPDGPEVYGASTPEEQAFKRWYSAYTEYCNKHAYMDTQRLGSYVQKQFSQAVFTPPAELWLVGFDEISPQLRSLSCTLAEMGTQIVEPDIQQKQSFSEVYTCTDTVSELELVAHWAYTHIMRGHSVGVIVPELERYQSSIEHIFRQYKTTFGVEDIELNLSVGKPLSQYGVIQAALRFLLVEEPFELKEFGYLLRSPWFAGGQYQVDVHAGAEVFLRTCSRPRADIDTYVRLLRQKGYYSAGIESICTALKHLLHLKERKSPTKWLETFSVILQDVVGWPGDDPPDSQTYQILQAWDKQILPLFASVTAIEQDMSRMEAACLLQRLSADTVFQAAAKDNRLHIVGLLEGVALACDVVWVMGLHDQVLPSALNHNTFIPVEVQKKYAMPRASMRREMEFCARLIQQLHALAPEVNFSYARCAEDGSARGASPFLAIVQPDRDEWVENAAHPSADIEGAESTQLEHLFDAEGLALNVDPAAGYVGAAPPFAIKGGTYLLKEQSMCPFRAYAHFRMDVHALEFPVEGVDMRVRGSLLHLLLQRFWEEIKLQEQLLQLSTEQCRLLLTKHCQAIMQDNKHVYVPQNLYEIEMSRLIKLALEWLEIDKDRPAFRVLSVEERERLHVGPLDINAVADRVDQILPNVGMVLLDYKTGIVALKDILGEHLLEPQLPVYALYGQHQPVVGFAVAQVRAGACTLKGTCIDIAVGDGEKLSPLPVKSMDAKEWDAARAQWRAQLDTLAQDVAVGRAAVDPVQNSVCQFCDLSPLCRVKQQIATQDPEDNISEKQV